MKYSAGLREKGKVMKNTKKGFTLVELLVVIAILAILATITIVGYTSFINRANESKAENEAVQIEQYIKSALMLDENVYIKKTDDYYIVCTRVGNDYVVSKTETAPARATQITEIPQNLVNGLEYIDVGGLTYTSDEGTVIVIKIPTSVEPEPEPEYSEGLKFTLNADGVSYSVSKGTCNDTNVVIPSTYEGKPVTSIGKDAFRGFTSLISVEIPNSIILIDDYAFYYCTSLADIEIPNSVTIIGGGAFTFCKSLVNIEIPNSITHINSDTFSNCSSLTNIVIPDSVTTIGSYAFDTCQNLESIEIPNSVTTICTSAFGDCTSLSSVKLTNSVMSIWEKTFENCTSLTSIDFEGTVSEWNAISKLEQWDNNTGEYTIRCTNGGITKDDIAFYSDDVVSKGLEFELIDDGHSYCVIGVGYCTDTDIIIPSTYNGLPVTSIGEYAFEYEHITSVVIPDSVTFIDYWAFRDCQYLTRIQIGNSVSNIRSTAFYNCTSLKTIVVDKNNLDYKSTDGNLYTKDGLTLVKYATGKEEISFTIPDTVTSIGDNAFSCCASLTSIEIPGSVTSVGDNAFSYCVSLTSIEIPDSVTRIEDWLFLYCTSLTSIKFDGTMEQWNALEKGIDWDDQTGAYVICCTDGEIAKDGTVTYY